MARNCTQAELELYIRNMDANGYRYAIEKKRGRRTIIHNGRALLVMSDPLGSHSKGLRNSTPDKLMRRGISLISHVKRNFGMFLKKSGLKYIVIKARHNSVWRNVDLWDSFPEKGIFYYVDVKHCFWRIAYILGYISKSLYEKTLAQEEMKFFRNMALACVIAPKSREYRDGGKSFEITEANQCYKDLYSNIRYYAYNTMGDTANEVKEGCFGYRTDGILVFGEHLETVSEMFNEMGFEFTIRECKKIDRKHYFLGDEIRKY